MEVSLENQKEVVLGEEFENLEVVDHQMIGFQRNHRPLGGLRDGREKRDVGGDHDGGVGVGPAELGAKPCELL